MMQTARKKERNKEKRVIKQYAIRVPETLLEDIKNLAEMHERSVNSEITYLLKKATEMAKKEESFGL